RRHPPDQRRRDRGIRARLSPGGLWVLHPGEYRESHGLRRDRGLPADPAAGHLQRPDQEPGMTDTTATLTGKLRRNYGALFGFVVGALALLVVAPAVLSDFRLSLLARFVCYAI